MYNFKYEMKHIKINLFAYARSLRVKVVKYYYND